MELRSPEANLYCYFLFKIDSRNILFKLIDLFSIILTDKKIHHWTSVGGKK